MVQDNTSCQTTDHVQVGLLLSCFGLKQTKLLMFRYQQLIKDNLKEVAKLITTEQGKTLADAEGDVMRGLQVRAGRITLSAETIIINY